MKTGHDKERFLKILEDHPYIGLAAKKAGISRASVYRFKKSDPGFKKKVEEALELGSTINGEIAESQMMKLVRTGHFGATKFVLERTNRKYMIKPPPEARKPKYGDLNLTELRDFSIQLYNYREEMRSKGIDPNAPPPSQKPSSQT